MNTAINLKFPFQSTYKGGVFDYNTLTSQALTDDLLCLLTTKRGNRVMRSNLYSPIYDYINEPLDDTTIANLQKDITAKINQFIPQIDVLKVTITDVPDENLLQVKVQFSIQTLYNITQTLVVNIPLNQGTSNG